MILPIDSHLLALPRLHWALEHFFEEDLQRGEVARESLLYLPKSGLFCVEIGGQRFDLQPGQLLSVPVGASYTWRVEAPTRCYAVFFASCQFEWDDAARLILPLPDDMTTRWMRDLCVLEAHSEALRPVTSHLLAALLEHLKHLEGRTARMKSLHPSVAAAVTWIDDNLAQSPTLNELAALVHCSPSHLRAIFKEQVGSGIMRYQQDRRMQLALNLVNHSHLSHTEVARRCGYNDVEYFARLFRRYYHTPPGQLRRNRRA